MSSTKQIPIDQLKPGMFVVDMDLPWYRTPFLFHKRLIRDNDTIAVMKQHGIRVVTIDPRKGLDVEAVASSSAEPPSFSERGVGDLVGAEAGTTTSDQTTETDALYAEARDAMDRIFADLERGVPPTPEATKAIVSQVLAQVLERRNDLLLQSAYHRLKHFDRSLADHGLDTAILSLIVAVESGVDPSLHEYLGIGALLHDAGYARLPRNLVRKRDECDDSERRLLQQHAHLGATLLAEQGSLHDEVRRIVLEHHEHGDGSGFPTGAKGLAISPLAEIVGIVDLYDKMVSRRGGRPAMLPHDAVRQLFLVGEQGQYPKALVEAVIRSIGVYPVGSLVRLNTGEQAVVVGVNPSQRLKPQVKITGGPHGESYANPERIDLAQPAQDRVNRTVMRVLDPIQERVNVAMYLTDSQDQAA
ncbi:MAG: DUF3391 domain-containing protein [Nitrospira sp.]